MRRMLRNVRTAALDAERPIFRKLALATAATAAILSLSVLFLAPAIEPANGLFSATPAEAASTLNTVLTMPDNALGLVGHWSFEGKYLINNVTDSSGQGNNGDLVGFASTTTIPGPMGQALSFNGGTQYVNFENRSAFNFGNSTSFTLSAWVKITANSNIQEIVDNGGIAWQAGFSLFGVTNFIINTHVPCAILGGGSEAASVLFCGSATVDNGSWHLITAVFDQTNHLASLYVDGVANSLSLYGGTCGSVSGTSVNYSSCPNIYAYDSNAIQIGMFNGSSYPFDGAMEDVRIYNRALSAAEIEQLYQEGEGSVQDAVVTPPNLAQGLVGHWPMDGKDLISNVTDTSGQGNNGDLVGFASTTTAPGPAGQALSFNGASDQYVNAGPVNGGGSFSTMTISAWVDRSSSSNTFALGWDTAASQRALIAVNGAGLLYFVVDPAVPHISYAGTGWHLYTLVFNGNLSSWSRIAGYIDGVQQTLTPGGSPPGAQYLVDGDFLIGGDPSDGIYSTGTIDDVRIYNRALSAAEIEQLYQDGEGSVQNTSVTPPNLAQGLVGWWTFDGKYMINNVTDTSGQGNNGYLVDYTSTTTAPGVMGQALLFNGSNQYVQLPDMPESGSFTDSCWAYPGWSSLSLSYYPLACAGRDNQAQYAQNYIIQLYNGHWQFQMGDAAANHCDVYDFTPAQPQQWTFLTAVYNAPTQTATFYVNDVSEGTCSTASLSSTYYSSAETTEIGDYQGNLSPWEGMLDDVRIYNRALSAAEVMQLYNLGH